MRRTVLVVALGMLTAAAAVAATGSLPFFLGATEGSSVPFEFVALPGEAGELGIYPRHIPLITLIKPGAERIKPAGGGEEQLIFVAGGLLEVQPKVIKVLADTAIRGHDLDESMANEALQRAEQSRASAKDKKELASVEGELSMLAAQLAAIRKLRNR